MVKYYSNLFAETNVKSCFFVVLFVFISVNFGFAQYICYNQSYVKSCGGKLVRINFYNVGYNINSIYTLKR